MKLKKQLRQIARISWQVVLFLLITAVCMALSIGACYAVFYLCAPYVYMPVLPTICVFALVLITVISWGPVLFWGDYLLPDLFSSLWISLPYYLIALWAVLTNVAAFLLFLFHSGWVDQMLQMLQMLRMLTADHLFFQI